MRRALLPVIIALSLVPALAPGQERDGFADPSLAPVEVVHAFAPATLPGAAVVPAPFVIGLPGGTTPEQFAVLVRGAGAADLLRVLTGTVTNPAALASLLNGVPASTHERVVLTLAGAPEQAAVAISRLSAAGTLAATINGVPPESLLALLTAVARTPEASALLLQTAKVTGQFGEITLALARRLEAGRADQVSPVDLDVLVAVSQFAMQDPRFRDVGGYSYFGKQLAEVRARVKAEGMTPEIRAAIVAIYHQATEALKAFQAAEAAEDRR